jgi:simple sugar transport system substrate-binding protein
MAHFGPKAVLTSIVNNWGPHYIQSAQSVIDGTWKSQDYWGGLKEGTVQLPISDIVPPAVKTEAEQIIASIKSGEFHPFTGPIKDQSGAVKIAEGATASNAELASMNYYIEGMTAQMPK